MVTVGDAPTPSDRLTGSGKPDLGRVLDRDLQWLANALWALGAEAVAINGQRLTATSTIRTAGEAILVDFRPVTSPYEVAAIGPDDMADEFEDSRGGRLFRTGSSTSTGMSVRRPRPGRPHAAGRDRAAASLRPVRRQPAVAVSTGATTGAPGPPDRPSPSSTPSGGGR